MMKRLSILRPVHKKEYAEHELRQKSIVKGDGFSIKFPEQPQSIDTGDHSRQYITKGKVAIYSVTVYDLATPRVTESEMRGELLNAVTRISNLLGWEHSNEITIICDLPAIQLTFELNKSNTHYYAVVVKNDKLYEIALNTKGNSEDLFTKFVNNFEFTD